MKNEANKNKKIPTAETKTIRIDSKLCDFINSEIVALNSNKKGSKSIKISDYLWCAVKKVEKEDRQALQGSTVTNFDLFEWGFKRFKRENKRATKDDFMGQIASGKLILCDYATPQKQTEKNKENT